MDSYELGPIRPPSEAYSLLIRATVNCPWNRCTFCDNYKNAKFSLRPVADIKKDIDTAKAIADYIEETAIKLGYGEDVRHIAPRIAGNSTDPAYHNVGLWLYGGGTSCFLQDANSIIMRTPELVEILKYIKTTFPSIERITSYGRSKTAMQKSVEELKQIHEAGLTRIHIGLETGYDPLLQLMDKGVTAAEQIAGGKKVVESGISLSEYVILGLGGKAMWREHATETARVLNEIGPDYIRVRTLAVNDRMPLCESVENGSFVRANDELIIDEERLLIQNLNCHANFVSDHITNLLQDIEGRLPGDKPKMLAIIDRFLALSPDDKLNFKVGRRMGVYNNLDDMKNSERRETVDKALSRLGKDDNIDEAIFGLMEDFV